MHALLDSLSAGLRAELDATAKDVSDSTAYVSHKAALESYAFLLQWFVHAAEKSSAAERANAPPSPKKGAKGKKAPSTAAAKGKAKAARNADWSWANEIPDTLELMARVLLKIPISKRIWQTDQERDAFVGRVALSICL